MKKLPIIFIGHGSPMNAIEDNAYTRKWREIGANLIKPKAIIIFSAHWVTEHETRVSTVEDPEMIYDMYGFPSELYAVDYPAKGDLKLAHKVIGILEKRGLKTSLDTRGLDHGAWSTLLHLFPEADIPVVTVSLDYHMSPRDLVKLGETLLSLREEGVLIMGSGNIVHNLRAIDWSGKEKYPWAVEFDARIAEGLEGGRGSKEWEKILDFKTWDIAIKAHPSWDHLLPLFPLMGASGEYDEISFFNEEIEMGSLSMRGVIWQEEK